MPLSELPGSQNWIGKTRHGNALFVPSPERVAQWLADMERLIHDTAPDGPSMEKGAHRTPADHSLIRTLGSGGGALAVGQRFSIEHVRQQWGTAFPSASAAVKEFLNRLGESQGFELRSANA